MGAMGGLAAASHATDTMGFTPRRNITGASVRFQRPTCSRSARWRECSYSAHYTTHCMHNVRSIVLTCVCVCVCPGVDTGLEADQGTWNCGAPLWEEVYFACSSRPSMTAIPPGMFDDNSALQNL